MPFLLPIFMFLAGLLGAGHIVSTIATAHEQAALRAASSLDPAQALAQFNQNVDLVFQHGLCPSKTNCEEQLLDNLKGQGVCQDAQSCAQFCSRGEVAHEDACILFRQPLEFDGQSSPSSSPQCPPTQDIGCPYGYLTDNNGCSTGKCSPPPSDGESGNCLKDAKQSIDDTERFQLKDLERRIKQLERDTKTPVPATVKQLMDQIRAILTGAKNLTDCQAIWDRQNEANSVFNELQDQVNEFDRAASDAQCVRDNLRGLKDFERSAIKDAERRIRQVQRQKVQVPDEITAALLRMKQLLAQAKAATNCQDMNDLQQELGSLQNEMQAKFEELEFLAQVPRMIKEITRELKRTESDWNRVIRLAKRSKADLSGLVVQGDEIIAFLKAKFAELKAAVASGDVEQIKTLADEGGKEAQEKKEDLEGIERIIEALGHAPRHLKDLSRRLTEFRRSIRQIARDGGDASALQSCVENFTSLLDEAKSTVAKRPIDPDELVEVFSRLEETGQECDDATNQAFEQHEEGAPE